MSLQTWQSNGWLRPYRTSPAQIAELFAIADRDLEDARTERLSNDWQFGIAQVPGLSVFLRQLFAAPELLLSLVTRHKPLVTEAVADYDTLQALPLILGPGRRDDADYLDACRSKRNTAEYDSVGCVSIDEARELVTFATALRQDVKAWLRDNHPELS